MSLDAATLARLRQHYCNVPTMLELLDLAERGLDRVGGMSAEEWAAVGAKAERAAIVAWLRRERVDPVVGRGVPVNELALADAIERGEHEVKPQDLHREQTGR